MRRAIRTFVLALIALPAAYLLAALVLGLITVNREFTPAPDGIAVYVRTNGVHAEFLLPAREPYSISNSIKH